MDNTGGRLTGAIYRSLRLVLEVGVVAALVLLTLGLVMKVVNAGPATAVLNAGILVLMGTPPAVVLVTAVFMAVGRDRWCLLASVAVLGVLAVSLYLAVGL